MMFRSAVFALLASATAAKLFTPADQIPADSALGASLLNKATVLEHARHLENNGERDVTFIAKYSIKYLGCSSLIQVNGEGNEEEGILYTQNLVRFALCPEDACSTCAGGGEYVVNMMDFVDAYTEAKLTEKEYACEMIRENCYCDNANDDEVCENQCYATAGMSECIEYEGEDEFEIQRYLECDEMENNGNNNNNQNNYYYNGNQGENYYGNYYIGPYCSATDGKSIHLGVFYDAGCTAKASSDVYASRNYGVALPFASESIVSSDCMSCKQVDNDNNNNNNNNNGNNNNGNNQNGYYYEEEYEVTEICEQSYEMAARCEKNMDVAYPDNTGCEYIHKILPRLDSASRSMGVYGGGSGRAAVVFAWLFAMSTIMFGAYAYFLYRKIKRGSVSLVNQ